MSKRSTSQGFDPFYLLCALTVAAFLASLWAIFAYAPIERQMGIVQKIFYFHVPSAIASYVLYFLTFGASYVYLSTVKPGADAYAVVGVDTGVIFCLTLVMSDPLLARTSWGSFWTSEPRLMLPLVLLLNYLAY